MSDEVPKKKREKNAGKGITHSSSQN